MSVQGQDDEVVVVDADAVRAITINRPARLNAITTAVLDSIAAAVESASADPSVRVITITGAGRAFCAGADIGAEAPAEGQDPAGPGTATVEAANRLALAIRAVPKVVVALVNGVAAGVGTSLVLAADLAIVSDTAYLKPGFEAIGLMPDGGGSAFLTAAVGRSQAMAIALLGDRISAGEAREMGLVARVVPAEHFVERSAAIVQRIAVGAPLAQAAAKEAINQLSLPMLEQALEFELEHQGALLSSADYAEGIAAFAAKRAAAFTGR